LLLVFAGLFAPVLGIRPDEAWGRVLTDRLADLGTSFAAVVTVLCLLRWRVASDVQALHIGLAVALYGASAVLITDVELLTGGTGAATGALGALRFSTQLAVIVLLGRALVPGSKGRRALLLALVPLIALAVVLRASPAASLANALPSILLCGLGVTYAALGLLEGRHLFAWTGVMLMGLAFADIATAVPLLANSMSPINALLPAALMLGGIGGYRDVRQAFAAEHQRMLASHVTALDAQALARDLRAAQEERAHEASSSLLAIESASGTLERYRDLLDGETREALAAALRAEITRLRALLDHASAAQPPAAFGVAAALDPVVVCASASGMRVHCAIAPDLRGFGSAAHTAQVVQQLLVNANRHAPGSPVEVTADRDGDSIVLRVADRGPGVAPHLRERVFERAQRGTASAEAGGRGLGLAIARQLMDDQGGALWYQDRPGGGACFVLRLPAAAYAMAHSPG